MDAICFKKLFQVLLVLLCFTQLNSQGSTTTPTCHDNGTITYSMLANVTDYLKHNKEKDSRVYFNTPADLKSKKIGVLQGFTISNKDDYDEVIIFSDTQDLINGLKNHTIDGAIVDRDVGDYIVLHNYDLYRINEKTEEVKYGPILPKDSTYSNDYTNFNLNNNIYNIIQKWNGINYDAQKVDKNLTGTKGTLKAIAFLGNRPYAYEDENGEATGSCIDIIYTFAKEAGYKVEFEEASTYDASVDAIKNKNKDITCAYITDDLTNYIDTSNSNMNLEVNPIIRLTNSQTANEDDSKEYYEAYTDLDGKKLGVLNGSVFEDITRANFTNSELSPYNDSYLLYKALFLGEIEGFLTDAPSAEDFQRRFPEKVSFFGDNFLTNNYSFAFQKNNSQLVNDFNSFLVNNANNISNIYKKWNVGNTSNITFDKTLATNPKKTIRVAMFPDTKPLCFDQNNEITGYEVELIYKFGREKNYGLEFITLENSGDRINYLVEDKTDISLGALTNTEERRKLVDFAYTTLTAKTYLVVRYDKRKHPGKIQALDENYNVKPNNTIYFPVKVGDADTVSACVFPDNYPYNGYALINCTISDLKGVDPTKNGLKLGNSTDTLGLNNVEYNPTNLLNGNTITGRNIISESNKTDYICYVATPTTLPVVTTPTTVATTSSSTRNSTLTYYKSSEKKLSTGAIIGIIIPCAVALLGATIGAFLCRRGNAAATPAYVQRLDTSNYKLNVVPQYPMEQIQVHQAPVQQVVPVQEVVPVQQVVPVEQVVPVTVQQVAPVTQVQEVVPVTQVQEVVPVTQVQQVVPVTQVQEVVPVTQVQQVVADPNAVIVSP